jgi:predicted enzyme related to lactoylglutathione lyase
MAHHVKSDHVEIVSKDPHATQKFMEKAFGLKFTDTGPDMGNYLIHGRNEGATAGGIGIRAPMGPEHPGAVPYLTVPSIDEALKAVQAAGGKVIMEKTEIPGMGWSAMYMAPGEVAQGLFQNKA